MQQLIVIGAGPGGYAAAFAAARAGMKVILIEKDRMGGTCLHRGCIPTKTLRSSADLMDMAARFSEFGLSGGAVPTADMSAITARRKKISATLEGGLEKTAASLGIRLIRGNAVLSGTRTVCVNTAEGMEELTADAIILATGSSPLNIPGLTPDHVRILSSDDALDLQTVPEHLLIVGGGVIGCELAFIYRSFGSRVTVVEGQGRLLPMPSVDEEISRLLQREMKKKGIAIETARTVSSAVPHEQGVEVTLGASPFVQTAAPQPPRTLSVSMVCITVGRAPDNAGTGLEEAGIQLDSRGWIRVDEYLETSIPGIYAIGDALGPKHVMLAHMATAEAHTAVHNILHPDDRQTQNYDVVPSAIFTAPEIGEVGLTEEEARARGYNVRISAIQMRELGKAQAMGALPGLFKLVIDANTDRLLGVHIAGAHASDLIAEAALAMQKKCTVQDLTDTIHAHPTLAEGLFEAALR